ncbi:MAG: 1-phosphatidylinositol phosphodiesterase, partial [Cryptosporangiaceae bacterium]|nr:1-phosphatidylinositol phosphodiesterase [Cryptosporangiaceae bacterium]
MPHTAYESPAGRRWRALVVAAAVGGAAAIALTPGTALAADPSYRTLTSTSNPDWMRALPDSRSLASISIPGTHETMAIHGGSLTETQENYGDSASTLATQLNAGIRMIDIRARISDGNSLVIHHGAVYQNANFSDVLNVLGTFLDRHPSESVVMRLKQECTGEFGSCTDASGQSSFQDIFDSYRDHNAAALKHFWQKSTDRT